MTPHLSIGLRFSWMTAGRGIAHSERTKPKLRSVGSKLFGTQSWVALSASDEEAEADFVHYGAEETATFPAQAYHSDWKAARLSRSRCPFMNPAALSEQNPGARR
jgi:redox-sensitive bicupin YhaK (pirin superfamily)